MYSKYCKTESLYEINISFVLKEELKSFVVGDFKNDKDDISKITFNQMYKVFDGVIDSMFSLMLQSVNNFTQTFDFLQFKAKYLKRKNSIKRE